MISVYYRTRVKTSIVGKSDFEYPPSAVDLLSPITIYSVFEKNSRQQPVRHIDTLFNLISPTVATFIKYSAYYKIKFMMIVYDSCIYIYRFRGPR